jgi:hypothetical protein
MAFYRQISFFVLFLVLAMVPTAFAQRCGGSTNRIYVSVRNDKALVNPRYEIISVSPSEYPYDDPKLATFISDTFFADGAERPPQFWHMQAIVLKPGLVENFLKTYRAEKYDPAPQWRRLKKENFSGPIMGGEISLPTGEMFGYPYILKVEADNRKPVYVLGAHLGGCFPMERIVIGETDANAYWGRWKD